MPEYLEVSRVLTLAKENPMIVTRIPFPAAADRFSRESRWLLHPFGCSPALKANT